MTNEHKTTVSEADARALATSISKAVFAHGNTPQLGPVAGKPNRVVFGGADENGKEHELGRLSEKALADVIFKHLTTPEQAEAEPAKAAAAEGKK
jgi:hypothetical protein